ncbi:hypothetical protein CHELA20_40186 [Hyphomicrobiales bacterium]|nr:hypothetical protein CHELA20_40186 [Hyphomicrobiales bacterium]
MHSREFTADNLSLRPYTQSKVCMGWDRVYYVAPIFQAGRSQ